jgi:hypothetical protein
MSRSKTLRFFQKIQEEGIIKIIPHQKESSTFISTTMISGPLHLSGSPRRKKKEKSEVFDVFWDKYHETMQKPKQYVARARREWTSSPKRNNRQPSTTSRKSTTTPTTHVSSPCRHLPKDKLS